MLLALGHRLGGLPGLVVLGTLLIAMTLCGLAAWLIKRGLDPLLVTATTLIVAVLTNIHWLARPHLVSWPLTLLLLAMLETDRRPGLPAFAILFAFWANLHGGFVYGWALIGMYLGGHLLEAGFRPERRGLEVRRAVVLARVLVVAMLATLLNPYGWRLPVHVLEFFRDPYIRDVTQEFLSPSFHSGDTLPFLAAVICVMALLACRPRPHWTHLAVLLGNLAMALVSQRNIALFALTAVPLIALDLAPWWDDVVGGRTFARQFANNARTGTTIPYVVVTTALLLLLAGAHGRVAGRELIADRFSAKRFPVAAVERARAAGLHGRLFHEFVWGGYLLYAWPEQQVFIDGGTDFYGAAILKSQRNIVGLQPGWRDSLDAWRINLALVRSDGAMAAELRREPGWTAFHQDSTAILLQRR